MSDRNGKVVEEKVPLRRADTLKKNRWRKSGTGMTSAPGFTNQNRLVPLGPIRTGRSPDQALRGSLIPPLGLFI